MGPRRGAGWTSSSDPPREQDIERIAYASEADPQSSGAQTEGQTSTDPESRS